MHFLIPTFDAHPATIATIDHGVTLETNYGPEAFPAAPGNAGGIASAIRRRCSASNQGALPTGGEMIALAFTLCLVIYAICFWLTFGELEQSRGAISSQSGSFRVGVDRAVVQRDGPAS